MSGYLGGLRNLLEFCCMPALGGMSDAFGRKPIIGVGLATSTIAWIAVAAMPTIDVLTGATVLLGSTGYEYYEKLRHSNPVTSHV